MTNEYFSSIEELETFINGEGKWGVVVGYLDMPDYAGMVLYIGIHSKNKYELNLEWMSLGLDFYGDTMQESYMYHFDTLKQLTDYLVTKYNIKISDIPLDYKSDRRKFPSPLDDERFKPAYTEAWERFLREFIDGIFLDKSLKLIYSSQPRKKE